jgi:hypothetical protein
MTTILNNTNISDLLEISSGSFDVLKKLDEEFKQSMDALRERAVAASASAAASASEPASAASPQKA